MRWRRREKHIPLVLAGYSPGQPEPDRMVYEFPRLMITEYDWTPREIRDSGLFDEQELKLFWNPFRYPSGTSFPRYLAPFHAWPYNQAEIMKKVVELGLASDSRHASPVHSNCPLNCCCVLRPQESSLNPYGPEFSTLIREGKAAGPGGAGDPHLNAMIRTKTFLGATSKRRWHG